MRVCTKCNLELSDNDFHPSNLKRKNSRCRKCVNDATASRYDRLRTDGLCFDCRKPSSNPICSECTERRRLWYHERYRDRELRYGKKRRRELKLEIFNKYGGPVCVCCGERHLEFLSIDHINGQGSLHRRQIAEERGKSYRSGQKFYDWLKQNNFPTGFQVLCFNCNFAKGHFDKCPHDVEREVLVGTTNVPAH